MPCGHLQLVQIDRVLDPALMEIQNHFFSLFPPFLQLYHEAFEICKCVINVVQGEKGGFFMEIQPIRNKEYYANLIECDWCGYGTHGKILEDTVLCTSCDRPLVDLGTPKIHRFN